MNKETIAAADFQRKPYATPLMMVVEIDRADIVCTSSTMSSTFSLRDTDFKEEEDW